MIDKDGNLVRVVGNVVEILTPGPALQAELDAQRAAINAHAAKLEANRVALDALALDARTFARGSGTPTVAVLTAACRKKAEMLARLWFNERFGDDP